MKARGVRLHAANDLRLEEFELPEITDDEILVKVVSDSICMSTYKCAILGTGHKRVHPDVAEHPAIMGHEFAGDIVKVGKNHQDTFKPGMKFSIRCSWIRACTAVCTASSGPAWPREKCWIS